MLIKVKRKERTHGIDLRPGDIMDLHDSFVPELVAADLVEVLGKPKVTNLGGPEHPPGSHFLVKLPAP